MSEPGRVRVFCVGGGLMTGMGRSSDGLDPRRRRILFRSWHRGMREMDLIMGRFADANIERLDEARLGEYERLMDVPDPELFAWILGLKPVPAAHDASLVDELRAFHESAAEGAAAQNGGA